VAEICQRSLIFDMPEEEYKTVLDLDVATLRAVSARGSIKPKRWRTWIDTAGQLCIIPIGRKDSPRYITILNMHDPGKFKYDPRLQRFSAHLYRLVALEGRLGNWLARERLPTAEEGSQLLFVADLESLVAHNRP
jgi:hypothetical protein